MFIKHAAIKDYESGIVYVGKRHHDCIATMVKCGLPTPIKGEQGFVTDHGTFVDREMAFIVASAVGQLKGREKHGSENILYSEDLY